MAVLTLGLYGAAPALAAVTPGGDTTVGSSVGYTYVGKSGIGALTIDGGSALSNQYSFVGNSAVADGTATISGTGSTWSNSSDLHIGYSGDGVLNIEAGGLVSNASGYLGYWPDSSGAALVNGTDSRWINSDYLYVGRFGSGTLTVTDGGLVTARTLYASLPDLHGNGTITASAGAVLDAELIFDASHGTTQSLIFGTGGTLNLTINGGDLGAGHKRSGSLRIAEGVMMTTASGYLGYDTGSNGVATVNGAGTKWTNSGELTVGFSGSGTLTIEAGAQVSNTYAYLGRNAGSTGAAAVRGTGSKWTNSQLYVGSSGSGALTIEAGGQVSTSSSAYIGNQSGSAGTATVSGLGSIWTSRLLYVGHSGGGTGTLTIEDGGQVNSTWSWLASQSSATVSGVGSKWTYNTLSVGNGTLRIEAGAQVISDIYGESRLGSIAGSSAVVTGVGSKWSNSWFYVGAGTLSVEAGGQVGNGKCYLGYNTSATGTATVAGAGSKWANTDLYVGEGGSGNLRIEAGGLVSSSSGYLGSSAGSTGTVTVSGTGSTWTDSGPLFVGLSGSSMLTIEAGGSVSNSDGHIGFNAGSTGTATVSGAGSNWTNSGSLFVGHSGSGTLTIEAGAQVGNSASYLGYKPGSSGTATVTGSGAAWTSESLAVGCLGGGRLTVANGGLVTARTIHASPINLYGNGTIAVNGVVLDADLIFGNVYGNTQTLTFGNGGMLSLTIDGTGQMGAGHKGSGSLRIHDGIVIPSTGGILGNHSGSIGTATVSGTGSAWINADSLLVGLRGSGILNIEAGGRVSSSQGSLGDTAGSSGTVTVTGAGSKWTNSGGLHVGRAGSGRLTVADGGSVTTRTLFASPSDLYGDGTIAANGVVLDANLVFDKSHATTRTFAFGSDGTLSLTIDGTGDLGAGYKGSGHLRIADGMSIKSNNGYLGYQGGSTGTAVVSGTGSTWANSGNLSVGVGGSGTLTIADGGKVAARTLSIANGSTVRLHVSGNDMLVLGDASAVGSITNNYSNGTLSFYADAFLPAGTYRPISEYAGRAITWLNWAGSHKVWGGSWNSNPYGPNPINTFTVLISTELSAGDAGIAKGGGRLLFTDPATGQRVGASFGAPVDLKDFSAAPMDDAELSSLAGLLEPGQQVLSAWTFTTNFIGEALLSFDIGLATEDLSIWHLSDGLWSAYVPSLLTYSANGIASFTATAFGGYALSAVVPPQWLGNDAETPNHWSTSGNWTTGVVVAAGGQALFPQSATNKTVDLGGGTQSAGTVRFASNENYTVQGGTLAINNNGSAGLIATESGMTGEHTISAAVSIVDDASISVAGGKLNLTGGVTIASGKILSVTQAAAEALSISALNGGTGTLSLGDATVTKVTGDSSIAQLALAGSAQLDLSTADLTVTGGDLATINGLVATGRAGGDWDGIGINSSTLAADSAHKTLAVLPEGAGVKVKYTWAGDLTGDGAITGADYFVLDKAFLTGGASALYAQGNVNYSGGIDGDDYFTTDRSFLNQSATWSAPSALTAAVPEPAALGLLAFAGSMLLARRRK